MLDHQHGHAVFLVEIDDEAGHVLLFLEVHAGHRLVEQDQFGLERHRAGELDPPAKAIRQRAGGRLAHRLQVEKIDDLLDLAPMIQFLAARAAQPIERPGEEIVLQEVVAADHDVVEHAHMMEQRKILEGAADPEARPGVGLEPGDVAAAQQQPAFGRRTEPRYAVYDRGLAGAVRTDDRKQLALPDGEAHRSQHLDAAEAQRNALHFECMLQTFLQQREAAPPQSVAAAGRTISDQRVFRVFAGLMTQPVRPRFRMRRARPVRRPTASQSRAPLLLSACAWDKSPAVATKLVRYGIVSRANRAQYGGVSQVGEGR